jgi:hypothetical protein
MLDKEEFLAQVLELMTMIGRKVDKIQLNPYLEYSPELIWVRTGIAKIFAINESGLKVNTDLIFKGELFLAQQNNYKSTDLFFLENLKYSEVYSLPLHFLNHTQLHYLPWLMMDYYNQRLQRIHQQKVKNYDLDMSERIFYLLSDFCLIYGQNTGVYYSMPNFFTHEDLASILRTCRQTITSSLSNLKRKKKLFYNRKEIRFEKSIFESVKTLRNSQASESLIHSSC